jgi:hypothetical protein
MIHFYGDSAYYDAVKFSSIPDISFLMTQVLKKDIEEFDRNFMNDNGVILVLNQLNFQNISDSSKASTGKVSFSLIGSYNVIPAFMPIYIINLDGDDDDEDSTYKRKTKDNKTKKSKISKKQRKKKDDSDESEESNKSEESDESEEEKKPKSKSIWIFNF